MPRKVLRRCSLCGKFHAAYLVPNPNGGHWHLCYACWKATQMPTSSNITPPPATAPKQAPPTDRG